MAGQCLNKHVCNFIQIYHVVQELWAFSLTDHDWLDWCSAKPSSWKKVLMHASGQTNVGMLHPCGHLLRKVWPLGSLECGVFVTFSNNTPDPGHNMGNFSIWCPGSGVVFDCMDSWSLPSSLLLHCVYVCKVWSQYTVRFKSYSVSIFTERTRLAKMMFGNTLSPSCILFTYWPRKDWRADWRTESHSDYSTDPRVV